MDRTDEFDVLPASWLLELPEVQTMNLPKPEKMGPKPPKRIARAYPVVVKVRKCSDCGHSMLKHGLSVVQSGKDLLCTVKSCKKEVCRQDIARTAQRRAVKKRSAKGLTRGKLDKLMAVLVKARGECEAKLKCAALIGASLVLQSAHGWGKKAYPAVRYERDNLFCLCSMCHSYYTWKAHEWVEWMQARMTPESYDRVRRLALANQKLDYVAIEADLRLKVAQQRARFEFAEAVS